MLVHREVVNGLLLDSIAYNFTPLSSVSMSAPTLSRFVTVGARC
jgi:hypothetical protein